MTDEFSPQLYDLYEIAVCDHCDKRTPCALLSPIKNPMDRLTAGDPLPAGECTECGSLAYVADRVSGETAPPVTKIYTALLTRDTTESALVTVHARDPEEAATKALHVATAHQADDEDMLPRWERNDCSESKPYFGDQENDITHAGNLLSEEDKPQAYVDFGRRVVGFMSALDLGASGAVGDIVDTIRSYAVDAGLATDLDDVFRPLDADLNGDDANDCI